jgi:hypothetical protein
MVRTVRGPRFWEGRPNSAQIEEIKREVAAQKNKAETQNQLQN